MMEFTKEQTDDLRAEASEQQNDYVCKICGGKTEIREGFVDLIYLEQMRDPDPRAATRVLPMLNTNEDHTNALKNMKKPSFFSRINYCLGCTDTYLCF
jgi:threonine synthase